MKYMCAMCGWIYDEEIGDPENDIAPGTKFQYLPDQYDCQFCYAAFCAAQRPLVR